MLYEYLRHHHQDTFSWLVTNPLHMHLWKRYDLNWWLTANPLARGGEVMAGLVFFHMQHMHSSPAPFDEMQHYSSTALLHCQIKTQTKNKPVSLPKRRRRRVQESKLRSKVVASRSRPPLQGGASRSSARSECPVPPTPKLKRSGRRPAPSPSPSPSRSIPSLLVSDLAAWPSIATRAVASE